MSVTKWDISVHTILILKLDPSIVDISWVQLGLQAQNRQGMSQVVVFIKPNKTCLLWPFNINTMTIISHSAVPTWFKRTSNVNIIQITCWSVTNRSFSLEVGVLSCRSATIIFMSSERIKCNSLWRNYWRPVGCRTGSNLRWIWLPRHSWRNTRNSDCILCIFLWSMVIVSAKKFNEPGPLGELLKTALNKTWTRDDEVQFPRSTCIFSSHSGATKRLLGISSGVIDQAAAINAHFFPIGGPCQIIHLVQCLVFGMGVSCKPCVSPI